MKKLFSIKRLISAISLILLIILCIGVTNFYDKFYSAMPEGLKSITFYYSKKPVSVSIGDVEYRIPKAYFNGKILYKKDGRISTPLRLWASIKDDMAPWPLSKSFKNRDKESLVYIYIYAGFNGLDGEYRNQFPYYDIKKSKERGGGINRGEYKGMFTRFDDTLSKRWLSDGSYEMNLHRFFLIPKEKDLFISCPVFGNQDSIRCRVLNLYTDNIAYKISMPLRIIEQYREYDKEVQKLINRLIYQPQKGTKNESS